METLSENFVSPPMSFRPGAFLCWLNEDANNGALPGFINIMDKGYVPSPQHPLTDKK